jgi:TolA-binding protein
MKKPSYKNFYLGILGAAALCVMPLVGSTFAKEKPKDDWQIRENLVTRLGGEWYKITRLDNELRTVQDIVQDIRDFELFPADLTRLNEEALVDFDKRVEKVDKKREAIAQRVEDLRAPLADGLAILRQMAVGQPVEDMFQVLDNDDIRRISTMFAIKHHIDSLWNDVNGLFTLLPAAVQPEPALREDAEQGFENEFFEILKANLGQQSEGFYRRLKNIKDTLTKRGSEEQCLRMFQVETHRIKEYLKSGNTQMAKTKLQAIVLRYKGPRFAAESNMLFAKACFSRGEFFEALETITMLPDSLAHREDMLLCAVQSRYLLKKYADLWQWGNGFNFKILSGSARNLALWLTMESGLALGKTEKYSEFATNAVKDSSYAMHVLHALGRYYVKNGDLNTAQSVFESALRLPTVSSIDNQASSRISLALAQLFFERKNYTKALHLFFDLLNREESFTEALYGISWCYIALGNYPKAETSLRKLVNQNPDSPLAVEGLLITMRRCGAQAKFEWEKLVYLTAEEKRLAQKLELIREKKAADTAGRRSKDYAKLSTKIQELLESLKNEGRASHDDIAAYYEKAASVSRLINVYYETGTFQEVVFSEKRETFLRRLDSLILLAKKTPGNESAGTAPRLTALQHGAGIKDLVGKSVVLATDMLIDRFKWEREYIDWQKTALKNAKEDLTNKIRVSTDSAFLAAAAGRQAALTARMDSLVRAGDELGKRKYTLLSKSFQESLAGPLDSADAAYFLYHLGEIIYDRENETYSESYAVYENKMTVFDSLYALYRDNKTSELPVRPPEPVLNHAASIDHYRTVLGNYPGSFVDHAARYSLAWCYNDQGMFDSAVAQMKGLAEKYPASQYAPQALLYVGEYMFDHGKLDKALKAYQAVIKYPESEWFDKALYKLAWTQYRLSNPEKAISSFLALVDLGQGASTGKSLLEKESIDYIAISFSETDATGEKGLERATNFVTRFGDQTKGAQILQRMASIFKEQGRFDMAQKTYRTLLRIYPEYKNSPVIESELLAVNEKSCSVEEANIGRVEFFNKYNKNSSWALRQNDGVIKQRGDSLACKLLYDAALSSHQLALQKNDSSAYTSAVENYEMFVRNYPKSPHAGECNYNLAEIMFSLGNYERAAEEYITVSNRYPDGKYRETAAWNAIVASQNLLKKETGALR